MGPGTDASVAERPGAEQDVAGLLSPERNGEFQVSWPGLELAPGQRVAAECANCHEVFLLHPVRRDRDRRSLYARFCPFCQRRGLRALVSRAPDREEGF